MHRWREAFEKRVSEEGSLLAVVFPPKTYPWLLVVFIGITVVGSNWGNQLGAQSGEAALLQRVAPTGTTSAPEPTPHVDDPAKPTPAMNTLTPEQQAFLADIGWKARTSGAPAIWVSVDEQMLRLVRGNEVLFEAPCATSEKGTGSQIHSNKTPLGWHTISKRIGEDAPWGQVFRSKMPSNEIWKPGQKSSEDLVLSRILVLDGLEEGLNKGGDVDSFKRLIYVHGTNGEDRIGTPSSHGCVRLRNDDVIALFELALEGTRLVITERSE